MHDYSLWLTVEAHTTHICQARDRVDMYKTKSDLQKQSVLVNVLCITGQQVLKMNSQVPCG